MSNPDHYKILIADDDKEDLFLIEEALTDLGHGAKYVFNGIEVLEYLEQCATLPCVIILDLNMPKLNGTETLQTLKKDARFEHIPVLIYSTSINPFEKEKCARLGAKDYVAKPITHHAILTTMEYFISFIKD
ncbi:MAG: response regulator [Bacteroidota bacterium]